MKKKIISIFLTATMIMGTLSGCGNTKNTSTEQLSKDDYSKYFTTVDNYISKDIKYIQLDYTLDGNIDINTDESPNQIDLNNCKSKIIIPLGKNNTNVYENVSLDTGTIAFAFIDDYIYNSVNNTKDDSQNFSKKIKVDDYKTGYSNSSNNSESSMFSAVDLDSLDMDGHDNFISILNTASLYDTDKTYTYKETKTIDDKTYDILTSDEKSKNDDSNVSTEYYYYVNTKTNLLDKIDTDIIYKDKTLTITCNVSYLKDIKVDNESSYNDTSYDDFSSSFSSSIFALSIGQIYFKPNTYKTFLSNMDNNTESSTENMVEDLTETETETVLN